VESSSWSGWLAAAGAKISSLARASAVVAFSVTYTGIRIEKEQQARIFEEFAQADGSTARVYGGTGLGLSTSRKLVLLLGGDAAVTSGIGKGSTFTVYVPAGHPPTMSTSAKTFGQWVSPLAHNVESAIIPTRTTEVVAQVAGTGTISVELRGSKLLIVDDDMRNIFAMRALLEGLLRTLYMQEPVSRPLKSCKNSMTSLLF